MRRGLTKRVISPSTRNQSEHKAIDGGQIRGTLAGAIADDELLLEQEGFCGDGADTAGTEEFCDSYDQVNRQKGQIAHGLQVITPADTHKTAPQGLLALYSYEFAYHTLGLGAKMVLVGRATLYGTACGGQVGAARAIKIPSDEMERSFGYVGVRRVSEIGPQIFARRNLES